MSEEIKTETVEQTFTEEQVKKILDTSVNVKISLIRQMSNLIDVCNKRGAFQSSELEGVGSLYKILTGAISEASNLVKDEKLPVITETTE
jgi:hypothetical protein